MGKAIAKTIVFLLIILVSCVLVNWVLIPNSPGAYQAAKLDKLDMLAQTKSPKIVLVGGSNLAFSIDSEALSNEYGLPVVNMGLAKSVGLGYLLEEARPFISEGDLVILAPEYELFFDLFHGSDGLIVELQYYPQGFRHLNSWGDWATVFSKFGPIMQAKFTGLIRTGSPSLEDSVYRRTGFNEFGDLETHLDLEPRYETHELFPDDIPFEPESVEMLNAFNEYVLEQGGRVLFSWPPLVDEEFERHRDKIWPSKRPRLSDNLETRRLRLSGARHVRHGLSSPARESTSEDGSADP
jgi:hypothetical protein